MKAENASAQSVLAELRSDLERHQQIKSKIEKSAHMKAGMMLGAGFLGTLGQLVGFYFGIYHVADWNEMEPWTWIACKCEYYDVELTEGVTCRGLLHDGGVLVLPVHSGGLGLLKYLRHFAAELATKDYGCREERRLLRPCAGHGGLCQPDRLAVVPHQRRNSLRSASRVGGHSQVSPLRPSALARVQEQLI